MASTEVRETNREVIYLHTGQCGVQMGNAVWEMMSAEHGITANGMPEEDRAFYDKCLPTCAYTPTMSGYFIPRALMIDAEPTVIDEIRTGRYRNLYGQQFLINGIEDAANNFARGQRAVANLLLPLTMRRVREQVEQCCNLQAFFFVYGLGGGTGAGLNSSFMKRFQDEYNKKDIYCFCVGPGRALSTIIVEPINVCLAKNDLVDYSNSVVCVDNESLYRISSSMLDNHFPTYNHINRLLAQVFSDLTCSYRYENWVGNDLGQVQTNIIPYPRIHFLSSSYAPLYSMWKGDHATENVAQMTRDVFTASHQLTEVNLQMGKFMACSLQYRGLLGPAEINQSLQRLKRSGLYEFVDWCPTGFKVGICSQRPIRIDSSMLSKNISKTVLLVGNSTAVGHNWQRMLRKYNALISKRAFIYWYISEGMEEMEFHEAQEEIQALVNDYTIIEKDMSGDDDEEKAEKEQEAVDGKDVDVPFQEAEFVQKLSKQAVDYKDEQTYVPDQSLQCSTVQHVDRTESDILNGVDPYSEEP